MLDWNPDEGIGDVDLGTFLQLRTSLEEELSRVLLRSEVVSTSDLLILLNEDLRFNVTVNQLRHIIRQGILEPNRKPDSGNFEFSFGDVSDAILYFYLVNHPLDIPRPRILCLFRDELREKLRELVRKPAAESITPPDQVSRAFYYWRSSIVMIILHWLFDGNMPLESRLAISRFQERGSFGGGPTKSLGFRRSTFSELEGSLANPPNGTLGLVTTRDREILHKSISWEEWKKCHKFEWYSLKIEASHSRGFYGLIIAAPNAGPPSDSKAVLSRDEEELLRRLFDAYFLTPSDLGSPDQLISPGGTRLEVLINLIPIAVPVFERAAIFIPSPSMAGELIPAAVTQNMKSDGDAPAYRIVSEEPLSGWAYSQQRATTVWTSIGPNDPRLSPHAEGSLIAAAAIPTTCRRGRNGILFVGTKLNLSERLNKDTEKRLLCLFALVAGHLLELEHMRDDLAELGSRSFTRQHPEMEDWRMLEDELGELVEQISESESALKSSASLHLTALEFQNFDQVQAVSSTIAEWVMCEFQDMAYRFAVDSGIGTPQIYRGPKHAQFVLLVPRIKLDDPAERRFRGELRGYMNNLKLPFHEGQNTIEATCGLWTLPFRYKYLRQRIDAKADRGIDRTVEFLLQSITDTFRTHTLKHAAHEAESTGNYGRALELWEQANAIEQNNEYIQRHIARAATMVHNYEKACYWWLTVNENNEHSSHHRRLGYNYLCRGNRVQAIEHFEKSIELDSSDPLSHEQLGIALTLNREFEEAENELNIAARLDQTSRYRYQLRIAQSRWLAEKFLDARHACERALSYRRDDPEALFWLVLINSGLVRKDPGADDALENL